MGSKGLLSIIRRNNWSWCSAVIAEAAQFSSVSTFMASRARVFSISLRDPWKFMVTRLWMWLNGPQAFTINHDGMDKLKAAIVATGFFLLSPIKQANNCNIQPAFELPKAVWNVHVDKATKISFFFFFFSLSVHLVCSSLLPRLCCLSISMWPIPSILKTTLTEARMSGEKNDITIQSTVCTYTPHMECEL